MLRLEARVPFTSSAAETFFGRSASNYLMEPGGLTQAMRSQLVAAGVPLERTDVANPFIQVFKRSGIFSNTWIVQYTGWIDGSSPLPLGDIQNRWTNAIVQSMVQSGLAMSAADIRASIDQGFSKYAPERLRTPSGAPNFAPLDNPGNGAVSWFSNSGATGQFIGPQPLPNPNNHETNGNNGNTGNPPAPNTTGGGTTYPLPQPQPQQPASRTTSPIVPLLVFGVVIGGIIYLGNRESQESDSE